MFKILICNVQIMIYFNKESSSSRTKYLLFKSILPVSQDDGEELLIHVTVYNSALFELSLER